MNLKQHAHYLEITAKPLVDNYKQLKPDEIFYYPHFIIIFFNCFKQNLLYELFCYRNPYEPIPGDVYAQGPDSEVADDDSPPSEDPAVMSDTADVDMFPAVSAPDIIQGLIT